MQCSKAKSPAGSASQPASLAQLRRKTLERAFLCRLQRARADSWTVARPGCARPTRFRGPDVEQPRLIPWHQSRAAAAGARDFSRRAAPSGPSADPRQRPSPLRRGWAGRAERGGGSALAAPTLRCRRGPPDRALACRRRPRRTTIRRAVPALGWRQRRPSGIIPFLFRA